MWGARAAENRKRVPVDHVTLAYRLLRCAPADAGLLRCVSPLVYTRRGKLNVAPAPARSAAARALVQLSMGSEAYKAMIAGGGGAEFLLAALRAHAASGAVVRDVMALVRAVTTDDDMVAVMSKACACVCVCARDGAGGAACRTYVVYIRQFHC